MPKGKPVLTYDEQEELCYRVLCAGFPTVRAESMGTLFRDVYGVTLTETCFRRAQDRLKRTPDARQVRVKYQYLIALFVCYPGLPRAQARVKAKLAFGEDTRDDMIEEMRGKASREEMPRSRAEQIIRECEARVVALAEFDFTGEGHGEESFERPQR